jgi:hypothetical protein
MPCCANIRQPVAMSRSHRSGSHLNKDRYSVGDLSSLYRSSCYSTTRCCQPRHRPQLIAEFVDIIDKSGPRRLYSKRYCYPTSSSSKLDKKNRASPRDSSFLLQDLLRPTKYYSRSPSEEERGI